MSNTKYLFKDASLTDVGRVRQLNEDRELVVRINSDCIAYLVCDGMGGHDSGDKASEAAVRFISEYLTTKPIENTTIALVNAIKFANQQIYFESQVSPTSKGMGTTAVALFQYQDELHIGHVGDSRAYLFHDNKLTQITKDHSVVQDMVDQGLISQSQAEHHPRKNEITKALGIRESVEPSISKNIKAVKGDRIVLCSDGLSGLISHEVFEKALRNQNDPYDCALQLIKLANQGGGHDNITVQVIDVVESPHKPIKKSKSNQKLILSIAAGVTGIILVAFVGLTILSDFFQLDNSSTIVNADDDNASNVKTKSTLNNSISLDSLYSALEFTSKKDEYSELLDDKKYSELKRANVIAKYDSIHERFVLSKLVSKEIKSKGKPKVTSKPIVVKKPKAKVNADTTKKTPVTTKKTQVNTLDPIQTDTSKKVKKITTSKRPKPKKKS
jgi:protein phosphatase